MKDTKFCSNCGAKLDPDSRFCSECGFDTQPQTTETAKEPDLQQMQSRGFESRRAKSPGNKNALIVSISVILVIMISGGGLYLWLLQRDDPGAKSTSQTSPKEQENGEASQNKPQDSPAEEEPVEEKPDLTQASIYLPKPGLKSTFSVNYPDGMAGVVKRISAQAVPSESVLVSEVETGVDQGVDFGYGFHYVERPDGTYYILDQTPNEIFPVLKNNLFVGQSWSYQDEFGQINWTVLDMGVDLDLGFKVFEDCLMVQEDNQAVGFKSITYYAPGYGSVRVMDPGGSTDYYRMTALEQMDLNQAKETVINWSPNYSEIKDDRSQ